MEQLKRVEYRLGDNIMDIIQNSLYECYNAKVDFTGPDPKTYVTIETGLAGMYYIDKHIKNMVITSGMVINASDISNKSIENGITFISYVIPFLANVKFVLDDKLDPVEDSDGTNPIIDGYRLSSYTYKIIQDNGAITADIVCVGKLPIFQDELLKLVKECKIADKYEMYPTKVVKYIVNQLKNLE